MCSLVRENVFCTKYFSLSYYKSLNLSPSQIYICGGYDGEESVQTGEFYDPETNQWTMIASMGTQRSGHGVVAYVGHIYAVSVSGSTFWFLNPFSNPDLTPSVCSFSSPDLFPPTGRWIWWPWPPKKRWGLQPPNRLMESCAQYAYCTQQLWLWSNWESGICCRGLQWVQEHLLCWVLRCRC